MKVVVGCEDGAIHGQTCQIGCAAGYTVQGGGRGSCQPDAGLGTASYQGQDVNCVPDRCNRPDLLPGEVIVTGCAHLGHHGCHTGIGPWACRASAAATQGAGPGVPPRSAAASRAAAPRRP